MKTINKEKKELSKQLKEKALQEGFAIAGIASIPGSTRIKLRNNALDRWLSNNYHSEMKWMEAERRKDIELLLKNAKSVLCVGFNYLNEKNKENEKFKIAKYGQGEDYHKTIYKKLKKIGKWINEEVTDCKWKICVDTSPLLEKAWAEESGLGWIGKNSNLINREYGSWLTLGFMLLTKELIPEKPYETLCGSCDKCIDQCPTKAIVEPFVVNSELCISYHTIESRNKKIPKEIEENLNGWIAGCDICQDICPWNENVPFNNVIETSPKEWMNDLNINSLYWEDKKWKENLKGSALKRIKPWMWKRNIKSMLREN